MSQIEPTNLTDASRWVGVAASMVEYLQAYSESDLSRPTPPRGILAGARRFFDQVLEGIALNRQQRFKPNIPILAGLSNLTVALHVLHRLSFPAEDLGSVEEKIRGYLRCLAAFEDDQASPVRREEVQELKDFFRALQDQGNRARHAGKRSWVGG
jgi:hypothetical protein